MISRLGAKSSLSVVENPTNLIVVENLTNFAGAERLTQLPRSLRQGGWSHIGFVSALVAIYFAAIANQIHLGVYTDPLWLMDVCARMLSGQIPYVDFLENSPPVAILIYLPPVLASSWLGINQDLAFIVYVAVLVTASLFASAWIMHKADRLTEVRRPVALTIAASLLLLPDYTYGQRDHIALILAMPWLSAISLRASCINPPRLAAIVSGLAAGLIFAIRPHYALSFVLVVAFVGSRRGVRALFDFPELTVAVAMGSVFTILSMVLFPNYLRIMFPLLIDVYARDRENFIVLLLNPTIVASTLLLSALYAFKNIESLNTLCMILICAALGVLVSFFIQGKPFAYHAYPCVALLIISISIAAAGRITNAEVFIAAFVGCLITWRFSITYEIGSLPWILSQIGFCIFAIVFVGFVFCLKLMGFRQRPTVIFAATCAFAAAALAWSAFHMEWSPRPLFVDEIKMFRPRPTVALVGAVGEFGHPVTNLVHGRWGQSVIALIITDSIDRIIKAQSPETEVYRKLYLYKSEDQQRFLSDVNNNPPDVIILDSTWASDHFVDPRLDAILKNYRELGRKEDTRYFFGMTHSYLLYGRINE
ncbi:hypothetical protein [Bradyrhizobium sp. DASA03120]|uniref:hypothetical protein n=1 Tax=Bradyrhizobium sp. SMVTL-02 TaxID=3395917 RepID=UPI003F707959